MKNDWTRTDAYGEMTLFFFSDNSVRTETVRVVSREHVVNFGFLLGDRILLLHHYARIKVIIITGYLFFRL